jgi:hypothetical protein
MKKILTIAAAFVTMFASAQIKMPAPSSTQKINQDFGMGAIELTDKQLKQLQKQITE